METKSCEREDYAEAATALAAVPDGQRENSYAEWLRALALYGGGKGET